MQAPFSHDSARVGMGATIALHLIAVLALVSYEPTRSAMVQAVPIMVEFITTQPERAITLEPARPKPVQDLQPPRPMPHAQPAPANPAPVIAAASNAPNPVTAPSAPATPPPPAVENVAPATVVAVTAPLFNAAYLNNPAPSYPPVSKRMREQGQVLLRVLVNTTGRADDVQLRTSSGFPRLDDSARDTVRDWKFVPARRGNEAVAAWVLIPISFRLEG